MRPALAAAWVIPTCWASTFRGEVEATGVGDATIAEFLAALRAGQSRGYSSPVRM